MTLELQATSIGSLAAEIIRSPEFEGTITNTFTNSFYVRTVKDKIIFFTSNPIRSPITVNLSSSSNKLHPLERVNNKDGRIEGRDVLIHVKDAPIYRPQQINPPQLNDLPQLTHILLIASFILEIVDTTNSVIDRNTLTHERIVDFVKSAILPLQVEAAHDEFRNRTPALIGLGSGFTPSGDDFLGGFLATYNTFANSLKRPQILLSFASLEAQTNWISAKLLDCMQLRILDEELAGLLSSATDVDGNRFIFSIESLASRGHTSGIDLATGVVVALSIIVDARHGSNITANITERLNMRDTLNG